MSNTFEKSYDEVCKTNNIDYYTTMSGMLSGIDKYVNGEVCHSDGEHAACADSIANTVDMVIDEIVNHVNRLMPENVTDETKITCIDALTYAVTESIRNQCYQKVAFGEAW